MRIIWWNLGYPFYKKWWRQLVFRRWDCFYVPHSGPKVRAWLQNSACEVFLGCEVVNETDAETLSDNRALSRDWALSQYHSHGRVVLTNTVNIQKKVIEDPKFITEWYDIGEYYVAPVHLHWSQPEIRLSQVQALVRAADSLDKPALIIGDFNMWMVFGRWFLFAHDKSAYQLLVEHFAEVTHSVRTTMVLPFLKLDYVFSSKNLACQMTVEAVRRPIRGTDHLPLVIDISD